MSRKNGNKEYELINSYSSLKLKYREPPSRSISIWASDEGNIWVPAQLAIIKAGPDWPQDANKHFGNICHSRVYVCIHVNEKCENKWF